MHTFFARRWLATAAFALAALVNPAVTRATATLVPMDHLVADVAYDAGRHLIYMSDKDQILRYDVDRGAFLAPFVVAGGWLGGMDIAPDGRSLAVTDQYNGIQVYLIDLDTGEHTVRSDILDLGEESGGFQVAYTREGNLLVSGYRWGPLRKLEVSTGTFSWLLKPGSDWTQLSTSGDGMVVGFAGGDDSGGPWGHYDAKRGTLVYFMFGTNTDNRALATNADGSRFIINGHLVYDGQGNGLVEVRDGALYPYLAVNDPVAPLGYFAFDGSSQVRSYDLETFALAGTFDFGKALERPSYGEVPGLRISRDGSMLLARFDDGVRYLQVRAPLRADDVSASTAGSRVQIPLQGHVGNGERLSYGVQVPPAHGRVFVEGATATYVPAPGYSGQDSFVYAAHYGMAVAEGTVTVDVTADTGAYAPQVSFDTLPVLQATTPIPGSKRVPGDFNGDGTSDLLWFNPATYQVGYWNMAPVSSSGESGAPTVRRIGARTFGISPGYLVGAAGDFDGDGYADLMFTSPARDLWLWTNSRTGGWRSTRSYDYPSSWQLIGAGDVDGDGKDDLLWLDPSHCQFAYWLMNGAVRRGARVMDVGCGYYPVGVGYYTPTNRISILWSSAANDLYVWDARGAGFRSYDLTGALHAAGFSLGLDGIWAMGGGYAGKDLGLEWNAQGQRFAVGARLNRSFDAQGIQTGYRTTLDWTGGLWMDDPQEAAFLIHGGQAPSTGLYALDPKTWTLQSGGLSGTDAAIGGSAPRTLGTEWAVPIGWKPVGAQGVAVPLPWR